MSPSKQSFKNHTTSTKIKARPNLREKLSKMESSLQSLKKDIDHQESYQVEQRTRENIKLESEMTR